MSQDPHTFSSRAAGDGNVSNNTFLRTKYAVMQDQRELARCQKTSRSALTSASTLMQITASVMGNSLSITRFENKVHKQCAGTSLLCNRGHVTCSPTASCTEDAKAVCSDHSDWKHGPSKPNHGICTESSTSFFQMVLGHMQAADMPPSAADQDCCYGFQHCWCWYLLKLIGTC